MSEAVKCPKCSGTGRFKLGDPLKQSVAVLKRIQPATAKEFGEASGIELSHAHHRLERLRKLGKVKSQGKYPAKYSVAG